MEKLVKSIERIELYSSMLLLVVMILLLITSVLLRYVFHTPAIWISATIILIFIWASLLSISYVYKKRGHIAITYFVDMFSNQKIKLTISIFIYLVIFISLLLAGIGTIRILPVHAGRFIIGLRISRVFYSIPILIAVFSMLLTTIHFLFLQIKEYIQLSQ